MSYSKISMLLLLVFVGCTSQQSVSKTSESFQMYTGPDGRVYRIDTRSGKVSWLDKDIFREMSDQKMPQLVIGKVYRGEGDDPNYMWKYQGNGKFEEWNMDKYFINQTPQRK
jgi:hypothetical protein